MDRFYRLLLRLLRHDFDGADRQEMWETYRARIRRAAGSADGPGATRVRLGELADLAASVARELWPFPSLDAVRQDVHVGTRSLLRTPVASALAVVSLALGIGATTSLFSALDVWLFRPLPLNEPDRLVAVGMANFEAGWSYNAFSVRDYADWSGRTETVELGVWARGSQNLASGDEVRRVATLRVSANLPAVLGIDIVRGRDFTAEDGAPGAPPVALVTDRLFRSLLGADPDAVGATLTLDGVAHTVVGVMHPEQGIPTESADVWRPLRISGAEPRGGHSLWGVARMHDGVGVEAASDELGAIARTVVQDDPEGLFPDAAVRPFRDHIYNPYLRQAAAAVGVPVLFVLLIACANIANILLARGLGRTHEMAVRGALGAGRRRIVQQLLVESLVIAAVGGVLGIGLAFVGLHLLLTHALAPEVPGWAVIAIDGRMLAIAAGLTVASVLVFGLAPALRASRVDLRARLSAGGRDGGVGRRGKLAPAFVVAEISASLVLLVMSGLMIRAIAEMRGIDLGMELDDALTFRIGVPPASRGSDEEIVLFYEELADRLRAEPGVTGVAYASGHFLRQWSTVLYGIPGRTSVDGSPRLSAEHRRVSPAYADVLGITTVAGRWFDRRLDTDGGPGVAVVSQELAGRWWPSPADAVGQTISTMSGAELRIVGVVEDTRIRGPNRPPPPTIFEPFAQRTARTGMWMVRHGSDHEAMAGSIRSAVRDIDADLAVFGLQTGAQLVDDVLGEQRVGLRILGSLGALGLTLTLIGVYGVMAHTVGRQLHEMGLRMALGAAGGDLLRMVLARSARTAAIGLGIGLVLSLGAGRGLGYLLADVSPHDPVVLLSVPALMLCAIVAASVVPALRAARVDPVRVMRGD